MSNDPSPFLSRYRSVKRLMLGRVIRRIPVVRQLAATDCGAACLAMVLGYNGKEVPLDELRRALGIGRDGATATALLNAGRSHGLRGRGVRVEMEGLPYLPQGAILYWEFRHFVVFERYTSKYVVVIDPGAGRRKIPIEKFRRAFTGVALVFERTEAFTPSDDTAPRSKTKRIAGLMGLILERRDLVFRLMSTSVLVQVLSLAMPLLTGVLIDRVVPHKDYSLLLIITLGFCAFQIFNAIAGFVRAHLLIHLRTQIEVSFTLRFLDHLIDLPYAFFQQHTSGDLMVRLGSNNVVRDMLTSTVLSAFLDGAMATFYLGLLLLANVTLTVLVILLAGARMMLLAVVRWRQKQFLAETLENQARSQTYQVEMLSGMETLKAMGLEHRAAEHWSNVFVDGLNISIRRGRLDAIFSMLLGLMGTVSTLALMFYGTYLVLQGTFTLGTMMAFSALAGGFLSPLNSLLSSALQLQMVEVYLERLNDVMDAAPEQDPNTASVVGPLVGAIALEKVSFRYGGPQDRLVVDDVTVEVQPGAKVALVGRTGSGKSTLARLMAGLYDPTTGRILFDGNDLKNLDRSSVRSQLGIVTQETQLFGGSIRRNIALSDPQMGLERIVKAAKLACIHDDIIAMPMSYETPLADRGLSLSGGQRQRLALARALVSNPKLLILDEATSHLDALTEENVNRNLAALRCTRIVIAHRLSTIRDADLILVLENGKVVERGTHNELLDRDGEYAHLLGSQRDEYVAQGA